MLQRCVIAEMGFVGAFYMGGSMCEGDLCGFR